MDQEAQELRRLAGIGGRFFCSADHNTDISFLSQTVNISPRLKPFLGDLIPEILANDGIHVIANGNCIGC